MAAPAATVDLSAAPCFDGLIGPAHSGSFAGREDNRHPQQYPGSWAGHAAGAPPFPPTSNPGLADRFGAGGEPRLVQHGPFVLTDNLFYLLLLALFVLMALMLEQVTWSRAMAFGLVWGLLFLSREIGLYCGLMVFLCLSPPFFSEPENPKDRHGRTYCVLMSAVCPFWRLSSCFGVPGIITLGIISLGEGRRFYTSYTQKFERKARHPYYENGTMSFFHLRPYEVMEFTRFPRPDDERYPPSELLHSLINPLSPLRLSGIILSGLSGKFSRHPGWFPHPFFLYPFGSGDPPSNAAGTGLLGLWGNPGSSGTSLFGTGA